MNRPLATALLLLATAAAAWAADPVPKAKPSAPIKDFRLPTFDLSGKKATFLRAGQATYVSPVQVDVRDMQFTLFTKDGTGGFDTLLLAPSATFLTDQQIASGTDQVRLIRANLEVTGEQWSYRHLEKRVLIAKNARVTFQDELKDLIK